MSKRTKVIKIRQKIHLNQSFTRKGKTVVCVSEIFTNSCNKREANMSDNSDNLKSKPKPELKKKYIDDDNTIVVENENSMIDQNDQNSGEEFRHVLINFLSLMYALFLVMIGAIITISGISDPDSPYDHIFETIITLIGIMWMIFFHWDIQKYKKWTVKYIRPVRQMTARSEARRKFSYKGVCVKTEIVSDNYVDVKTASVNVDDNRYSLSDYLFCHGKNSGNFYLKCGMILFCMGSIVHQGVIIAKQIHYFSSGNKRCFAINRLLFFLLSCISCFYQLYIIFKYSNILINRHKTLASFSLMHLVGSSVSFWFSTIIEETIEDYVYKVASMNETYNYSVIANEAMFKDVVSHHMYCYSTALVNTDSMEALPYLYPFSIEYNIILASVWYIIWSNIGKNQVNAQSLYITQEMCENDFGQIELSYKSSMSVNADCHASNLGLFVGLSTLLLIFSTMVIFFAAINQSKYRDIGIGIYSAQIGALITLCVITIPFAYLKIRKLNIVSKHHLNDSSSSMDDFLILIPLPFFVVFYLLAIKAEIKGESINSALLVVIRVLSIIHVAIQTPFIVDASRRCANNKRLRFTKPGRGLVMFLLLLNITLWILYTFERKSVDRYHNMQNYYGKFIWMVITHTTMPLMLFYYFHCSVCLSDIWKYAYERDTCY